MTTALNDLHLKSLRVTGVVTITEVPQDHVNDPLDPGWPMLVMGPTGAGKSSFIEAIAGPNSSIKNLSSPGLEGYTQSVALYRVEGLIEKSNGTSIYLMDTPGFADDKISLAEIVSMVLNGVRVLGKAVPHILYVMPITNTRLSGSQRKVLKAFKAITGKQASGGVTIVTTMWDTIYGEQAQTRAGRNFEHLKNDIWKDFDDHTYGPEYSADITKFINTQASALSILDLAYQRKRHQEFHIMVRVADDQSLSETNYAPEVHGDLIERIQSLKMRKEKNISDLAYLPSSEHGDIRMILMSDFEQVIKLLFKFEKQLEDFGILPTLPVPSESDELILWPSGTSKSNDDTNFGELTPPTSHLHSAEPAPIVPPPTSHTSVTVAQDIYTSFINKIESLQMRKDAVNSKLASLSTSETEVIRAVLTSELNQFTNALSEFEKQLEHLGMLPSLQVISESASPSSPPSTSMPLVARRPANKKGLMSGLKDSTKNFVERLKVTRPGQPDPGQ